MRRHVDEFGEPGSDPFEFLVREESGEKDDGSYEARRRTNKSLSEREETE